MNIAVLIAGVHDPKWPLSPELASTGGAAGDHRIMSPFDEAALEMALRVRDAQPATGITVHVAGGAAGLRIARTVAALNVAEVAVFSIERPWDQVATAHAMAGLVQDADLILLGREFGDFDDGLVPALLAGVLGVPFFGRVQTVETQGSEVALARESGSHSEQLTVSGSTVASATNDRRTRLRKPLMKNVMLARQAVIGEVAAPARSTAGLALERIEPGTFGRSKSVCTLIPGSPEEQAQALAALLWQARA